MLILRATVSCEHESSYSKVSYVLSLLSKTFAICRKLSVYVQIIVLCVKIQLLQGECFKCLKL